MAYEEGNGNNMVMPVAPAYGGGYGGGFGSMFGGDGAWVLLLILLCGWGNGFGGGFGGNQLGYDFPWLLNGQNGINNNVSNGFRDAQLNDGIMSIRDGINGVASQMAQCCCENRAATADVKYTVASEACATRTSDAQNTQSIINAIQGIKDQLCADKLEAKNDLIAQLRQELMFARGQASQDVQTATIQAGQRALANEVEQYVLPTPRPAYIVSNPNCCNPATVGCGCGSF